MADRTGPDDEPRAFKTMIHPDKRRSFAVLAVVAIDTEAYDLHLVAGTKEPYSWSVPRKVRGGLVPDDHKATLFAAFNGGFKTTHGSYAMRLGEHQFLTPRDLSCTFVRYATGEHAIGTWSDLKKREEEIHYYRQTPPCLVEGGKVHSMLHYHEYAKGWGATVSGDTVIRRSAIGLSKDKRVIYYGIGEAMTAQALARGMKSVGAHSAAELDVNYSYPRWLMYELLDPNQGPVATSALIPNIEFTKWQYVGQASPRDFFYVTRNRERAAMDPTSDSKLALGD
jgi:hypothetical protein